MAAHSEDTCDECGGANPVWFADNDLWNAVVGSPYGILCPSCFATRAETNVIGPQVWRFAPTRIEATP